MAVLSPLPDTFSGALRFLRKRARLTQDELGRAVGYSREQIARLENGTRLPDLAVIAALFVPALFERHENQPGASNCWRWPAGRAAISRSRSPTPAQTRLEVTSETVVAPALPAPPAHSPPAPLLPLIGRAGDVAGLLALLQTRRG